MATTSMHTYGRLPLVKRWIAAAKVKFLKVKFLEAKAVSKLSENLTLPKIFHYTVYHKHVPT